MWALSSFDSVASTLKQSTRHNILEDDIIFTQYRDNLFC